ncbi:Zinc/iron permease [Dichotomocladium elegans]|nr:Zinc/iron permease [Dichotomocladium elegans]
MQYVPSCPFYIAKLIILSTNLATADACKREDLGEYDMFMRVGSLFIILLTSAIAIFAPMALHRIRPYHSGSTRDWILTVGKFFGTGVILATAFIHMLPGALAGFASPCLSPGWKSYSAFAGVFCMIASFALQLLEMTAMTRLDLLQKKEDKDSAAETESTALEKENKEAPEETIQAGHMHGFGFLEEDNDQCALKSVGTLILELGIAMHSIIVGITLSNTVQEKYTTLFVALMFHQFFEGIALGTRINEMDHKGWGRPLLLGLFFITMTPIGVAIGIGIHSSFSLTSSASVLSSAILDSLSAGILLYNAYVTLMSQECTFNPRFRSAPFSRKLVCFMSMYTGAALMSAVGKWS